MAKHHGESSRSPGTSGGLGQFALKCAREAAARGNFSEALEWLSRSPRGDPAVIELEAEIRYRHAAELIAFGRYADAEQHLSKAGLAGVFPRHLIDQRLHLLRHHNSALQDVAVLRDRFGQECDRCKGTDLYKIASCGHQLKPIPPARKLDPSAYAPKITGVYAACAYRSGWDPDRNDPMSQLIRGQKRAITPEVMRILGVLLADFIAFHTPLPAKVDFVVPVPSSRERETIRGGSLPFCLASTVRDRLALPLHESILQVGEHSDHTQAYGEARRRGLTAAWQSKPDKRLEGRIVLLVDDIVTTGITLKTAAEFLLAAGAAEVYAVALLHTESSL